MKLITLRSADRPTLGVLTERGVLDLGTDPDRVLLEGATALGAIERSVAAAANDPSTEWRNPSDVALGPVVPNPGKILCVGLNYRKHAAESGMAEPEHPVLFSKFNNTLAAPDQHVHIPSVAPQVDYEAELAAVIGTTAKNISVDEALDHVLGYCNANDLSDRHLQFVSGQWLLGKTLDGFMPLGPYLVTADEVGDPQDLRIRCWVNDDLRQDSNTSDMIFGVAECISYASHHFTLEPGDIVSTGTPEGVVLGRPQKDWLQPGDVVTVEVEGLGRLTNTMAGEA